MRIKKPVKEWVLKAEEDILAVENEIEFVPEERRATSSMCFHAQQAVEKYLKAYLVFKGIHFGKTHNLEILLELCRREDKEFESLSVGDLTQYAVELRYPDDFYTPTLEEAKEAYEIALSVRNFVRRKLGLK